MWLKESFCPFTRDALNFGHRKYMPRRTGQQCSGFTLITAPRDAPFNIPLYQCAFCSVTAHAPRKSRVRSNNAPTRNFYVIYLFLFAVALRTLGFFCKVAGKNPSLVAGCGFLGLFQNIWLLVREIWQATLFIYVRHILQCIDWHSARAVNSQPVQ